MPIFNVRNVEELLETFNHIKRAIDENEFDLLCICGNINADFSRNTGFVRTVQQQVDDLTLLQPGVNMKMTLLSFIMMLMMYHMLLLLITSSGTIPQILQY